MVQRKHSDIFAFQQEMEDAFRLDCSLDDIKTDKEAKKLYSYIKKCRKNVNLIDKLYRKILCNKKRFDIGNYIGKII